MKPLDRSSVWGYDQDIAYFNSLIHDAKHKSAGFTTNKRQGIAKSKRKIIQLSKKQNRGK